MGTDPRINLTETGPRLQRAQWPLKIIAAACTDGTFVIFIYLTPSPRSAHQRDCQREEIGMLKRTGAILSFLPASVQ
jgi:hypothetical protein